MRNGGGGGGGDGKCLILSSYCGEGYSFGFFKFCRHFGNHIIHMFPFPLTEGIVQPNRRGAANILFIFVQ
jgi:hypothetical protein